MLIDILYHVVDNIHYKMVSYHRGSPNPNKSVWDSNLVSIVEEFNQFKIAHNNNWKTQKNTKTFYFGVKPNFSKLGTGISPKCKDLYVAKFKDDNFSNHFHGYPIDYTNIHDKVPTDILKSWKDNGTISKVQMSRMQRCVD